MEALLAKERKDVDAKVLDEIDDMRIEDAEAVLARLEEVNLAKVTNTTSFLSSIVRRVKEEGSSDLTRCLDQLPRPLRNSLMRLMDEGRLRKGDLESRVATALRVRACAACARVRWLCTDADDVGAGHAGRAGASRGRQLRQLAARHRAL
jgi:hypothetical protein